MSYVHIEVDTRIGPVGAVVSGVDLSEQLNAEVVAEIHAAWLQHHVLFFVTKPCRRPLRRACQLFWRTRSVPIYATG